MAVTPKAPTCVSFMISSLRSRVRPPRSPSIESARPSACRARVSNTQSVVPSTPAPRSQSKSARNPATAAATIAPMMKPAAGKK